jgi:hypothetical protein
MVMAMVMAVIMVLVVAVILGGDGADGGGLVRG